MFADGTKTDFWSSEKISKFKVHRLDAETSLKTIKINYMNNESHDYTGCMIGLELLDWENKSILKAGDWKKYKNISTV